MIIKLYSLEQEGEEFKQYLGNLHYSLGDTSLLGYTFENITREITPKESSFMKRGFSYRVAYENYPKTTMDKVYHFSIEKNSTHYCHIVLHGHDRDELENSKEYLELNSYKKEKMPPAFLTSF